MNVFRSYQELLNALAKARLKADPLVSIVEILGKWVLNYNSFEEVMAVLGGRQAAGDQAGIAICPMGHSDSVHAVAMFRRLGSLVKTIRTPRLATTAFRLPRARTRTAAAVRTGPPGSSEDGDPEPGDAGPNSHRLEKIETANTRQGGAMSKRPAAELKAAPVNRIDVIIRESGIELHETASSLRGKGVASDRPVYFIGRAIDPAQEPKYLKPKAEHLPDEGHLASEVCIIPDGDPPAKDGRLAGLKGAQKTAAFLLMECRCQIQVRLVFNRLF